MSADVEPNFRSNLGECEGRTDRCKVDGCPKFGTLGRPAKDGMRRVKGCGDPVAIGRRSRRSGLEKQTVARKALGIQGQKFGDANEERWQDAYFANEVKSGAQVGPVANWWRRVEAQVLSNEADHGDRRRPVRAVAMPEGMKDGLVVVRLSTWETHVRPALEEFYGSGS